MEVHNPIDQHPTGSASSELDRVLVAWNTATDRLQETPRSLAGGGSQTHHRT